MNDNTDKGSLAMAFIAGTAMGVATALLMAPKSGKETREDIKNTLNDTKDKVASTVSESTDIAKSKLNDVLDTTKTVAKEGKRAAKEAKQRVKENRTQDEGVF